MPKSSMQAANRPLSAASQSIRKDASAPTEDHVYGLVSVLYHALQGAETYEKYVDDAERVGDDELVRFFEQCRDQESERASRAKQLLVERAGEGEDED